MVYISENLNKEQGKKRTTTIMSWRIVYESSDSESSESSECTCPECVPIFGTDGCIFNYRSRGLHLCREKCCLKTDSGKRMYKLKWINRRKAYVAEPIEEKVYVAKPVVQKKVYVPTRQVVVPSTPTLPAYSSQFGWVQSQPSYPVFVSNPSLPSFWSSGPSRSSSPPNRGGVMSRRSRYNN